MISTYRKDRPFILFLVFISTIVYFLLSITWPIFPGRDFLSYIYYYLDFFNNDPVYHMLMCYRTFGTGFFFGIIFSIGGVKLTYFVMYILFVSSVLLYYNIGHFISKSFARVFSIVMLAYLPYGILFHEISSDILCTYFLVVWVYYYLRIYHTDKKSISIAVLSFVSILLIAFRPSFQMLLLFAIPIFIYFFQKERYPLKQSLGKAGLFSFPILIFIISISVHNYLRYDSFTVSRGSNLFLPAYKLYTDGILFNNKDGKATREIINHIENKILKVEPYKTYNISINTFINSGNTRMYWDLAYLSDSVYGWNSDYRKIREMSIESIRYNFVPYMKYSLRDMKYLVFRGYFPHPMQNAPFMKEYTKPDITKLTEGQLIPYSHQWWMENSPDNKPSTELEKKKLYDSAKELLSGFYVNSLNPFFFNIIPIKTINMLFHIMIALMLVFSIFLIRHNGFGYIPLMLFILLNLVIIAFGLEPTPQYRLCYDFIFILYSLLGIKLFMNRIGAFEAKKG